jgi:hypothetical protein
MLIFAGLGLQAVSLLVVVSTNWGELTWDGVGTLRRDVRRAALPALLGTVLQAVGVLLG